MLIVIVMVIFRYVRLEQESAEPELQLDDFIKLERHGFHFLAQVRFVLSLSNES